MHTMNIKSLTFRRPCPAPVRKKVSISHVIFFILISLMPFLFECLPFELTFNILFRHGGFDALETIMGKGNNNINCCWEFLKLMNNSPRAELLCICRTVQLLEHPVHALFLLNYPPDSSIPENRHAWNVAIRCCITWSPDVRSVVLAMRAFISTRHYTREAFPWIDTVDLDFLRKKSEEEWKKIGQMQSVFYKFDSWWWNEQKEAFQLERVAAESSMWVVIKNTASAEMARLNGAIRRREAMKLLRLKEKNAWVKMMRNKVDEQLAENNRRSGGNAGRQNAKTHAKKKPVTLSPDDKKKLAVNSAKKREHLDSVLKSVKRALSISAHLFEPRIERYVRLIVSIEKENPIIKWNLRLLLHNAASETGVGVWETEFMVYRFHRNPVEENALQKIMVLH